MTSLHKHFEESAPPDGPISAGRDFWVRICEGRLKESVHVRHIRPSSHWQGGGTALTFMERSKDYDKNRVTASSHSFKLHIPLSFGAAVQACADFSDISTSDEQLNFTTENLPKIAAFYQNRGKRRGVEPLPPLGDKITMSPAINFRT